MEENYFIAAGIDSKNNVYWIQNTDPVMWSDDKSKAKRYENISNAEFDIYMNQDTIRLIFDSSSMSTVEIYEIEAETEYIIQKIVVLRKGVNY